MSFGRRIAAAALVALAAMLGGGGPAAACSCIVWEPGFLAPSHVELPSNGRGLPWWGRLSAGPGRIEGPPHDAFSVQRLDAGGPVDEPFALEVLAEAPVLRTGPGAAEYVIFVAPLSPLVPGARYRFTYRYQGYPHKPGPDVEDPQVVEVTVARDSLAPDPDGSTLRIWKENRSRLQVPAGGTCSKSVDAHQIGVELDLPEGVRRFKDALLFGVQLEGRGVWRYSRHICAQDVPGTSRVGRGRELLYTICGDAVDPAIRVQAVDPAIRRIQLQAQLPEDGAARTRGGLPEGVYGVEMAAWLPGTEVALRASREIRLRCAAEP